MADYPSDEAKIREVLSGLNLENFPVVEKWEFDFGEDVQGSPAVWIWFLIKHDLDATTPEMRQLSTLGREATARLLQSDLQHWPYVGFRVIPESAAQHDASH